MSKKDYVLIATALRQARNVAVGRPPGVHGPEGGIDMAIGLIAQALARDNPRFQPDRFLYFIEHGNLQGYFSRRR